MNRIRDQRQRVGGIAEHQLGRDEHGIERNADGERKAEIVRRVTVAGMAVRVGVIVMMGHDAVLVVAGRLVRPPAIIAREKWRILLRLFVALE